jgi:O-antigen biosynthesis protein WbqP|tara:strand:- start:904 stop:1464 length:561 start_codon:yes stop_codon:yes gene_type:complete
MKRLFDITLTLLLLPILLVVMIVIALLVRLTSKGPVIHWSDRVGRKNIIFKMPKFRTMHSMSPNIASNLLKNPENYLTNIGSFLRKSSLDEIPQIISVLKGDMSIVGPRPALFNQYDLIKLRTECSIDQLLPGVTGWAQVNGRDNLTTTEKVTFDVEYLNRMSLSFDLKVLWRSILIMVSRKNISH